jgi:hypothetical protein
VGGIAKQPFFAAQLKKKSGFINIKYSKNILKVNILKGNIPLVLAWKITKTIQNAIEIYKKNNVKLPDNLFFLLANNSAQVPNLYFKQ